MISEEFEAYKETREKADELQAQADILETQIKQKICKHFYNHHISICGTDVFDNEIIIRIPVDYELTREILEPLKPTNYYKLKEGHWIQIKDGEKPINWIGEDS